MTGHNAHVEEEFFFGVSRAYNFFLYYDGTYIVGSMICKVSY